MEKIDRGIRITLLGIIVNMLLAVFKITAGVIGTSYALIADGIESTTDIFSSLIVYSGLKIASKPPDENHPYGHGKAEALASIVVALMLVAAAIIIIINSIHEIITPHHAPAPFTLAVLVLVVFIKELMYRKALFVGNDISSTVVKTDAFHHRSDAITSVAAFIGISIALLAGEGYESADDYAALFASGMILFNAGRLIMVALSDIMDETPPGQVQEKIINTILNIKEVRQINNIKIRKSGLNYIVDLSIGIDGGITVSEGHNIAENVSDILLDSELSIQQVMVHVEPENI